MRQARLLIEGRVGTGLSNDRSEWIVWIVDVVGSKMTKKSVYHFASLSTTSRVEEVPFKGFSQKDRHPTRKNFSVEGLQVLSRESDAHDSEAGVPNADAEHLTERLDLVKTEREMSSPRWARSQDLKDVWPGQGTAARKIVGR